MKNTVYSIFFILLLTYSVKAQTPEVEWLTKNTRPDGDTYIEKLISLDNNGFLALRGREPMMAISYTKLFLQRYDNEFKPGIVKEIPYRLSTDNSPDNGKTPTIIYMGKFSDDVYIFTGSSNKDNNTHSLQAKRIDPETLDLDKEEITLFDVSLTDKEFHGPDKNVKVKPTASGQFEISNSDKDFRGSGKNFHITRSSDGNNLLALFHCPGSKDEQRKVILYVFDNKLQLSWKKEVTLNYNSEQLFFNACSIDNNGNVAISEILYKGKTSEVVARKINYEYLLFYLPANGGDVVETKLSISGSALARLVQTFDKKGNLVCGGLYTSPSTSNAKGVYILQTEPAKGVISSSSIKQFGTAFTTSCISDKVKERRKLSQDMFEDYGFVIDKLEVLENGEIKLLAEQKFNFVYSTVEVNVNRPGDSHPSHEVFRSFENVFCASADNTGTIQWLTRIPKKQFDYQGYDSYCMKIYKGTLYFFYNEALENIRSKKSIYFGAGDKFIPVVTSIDGSGKLTTDELWDPGTDKVMLIPKSSFTSEDNEIIVEAKKGKTEYFAKISFK